jgi:SpoVK/Ycf46/Vps4 family AAA+-type ATPase
MQPGVAKQNGQSGKSESFPTKSGGVQGRPSSSSGPTKNSSAVGTTKDNEGDDDELPEELQHLDKELVLKIQNDIMESGAKVTFDDIAGLEGAKEKIDEVICWPMRRPDLFVGLLKDKNGVLLYGPPGYVKNNIRL